MVGEILMSMGTVQMLEDLCLCDIPHSPYGTPRTLNGLPIKIDEEVALGSFVGEVNVTLEHSVRGH